MDTWLSLLQTNAFLKVMDQDIVNTSIQEWYITYTESYRRVVNGRVLFLLDPADQEYKVNEA